MMKFNNLNNSSIGRKIIASFVLLAFLLNSGIAPVRYAYAQELLQLPQPGTRVGLSTTFTPPFLKGVKVYPDNPFKLDFILDKGDSISSTEDLKTESTRLIKYFLASLTVPEKDLWVNLSPYEKDRIIPGGFGVTEMGRDLLGQDYMLKQITASVIYPEEKVGKEFWTRVYTEAQRRFGSTDVPVDTFNKVWIVPDKAVVYENKASAYVVESRLKVLLEEDYLALEKGTVDAKGLSNVKETNKLGAEIVREVVIPILEKEVNEGKNFAQLRQIYHSLILALWFKDKIRESILGQAYVDRDKVSGVDIADKAAKEKIWAQYVEAFKKGAYNYIKEDIDPATQQPVPRKYFSGGAGLFKTRGVLVKSHDDAQLPKGISDRAMVVESNLLTADNTRSSLDSTRDSAMSDDNQQHTRKAGVVFDLDGTLHVNDELNKAYRNKILFGILPKLKGLGYEEAKALYQETEQRLKASRQRVGVRDVFEEFGLAWPVVLRTMDELAETVNPKEYLSRDAQLVEQFKTLSRTHKIAVLSNNGRSLVERSLEALGVREYVDVIASRTELGEEIKPNPKAFEYVLREMAIDKENVSVIGDDIQKDIKPAEALGLKTALVKGPTDLRQATGRLLLKGATDLLAGKRDVNVATSLREAIAQLSKTQISTEDVTAIDLILRASLAFKQGLVDRDYFYALLRSANDLGLPLTVSGVTGKQLFTSLSIKNQEVGLNVPTRGGGLEAAEHIGEDNLEDALQYLRTARVLLENTSESRLLALTPEHVAEISSGEVSGHAGSAVLAVNDKQGGMHIFADSHNAARMNIRQVPDMDRDGMSNPVFERATEVVPLRAYKSQEVKVQKFRGWDLLPDELKSALSELFAKNMVPLTLASGEEVEGLGVALETSRQNDVAPGRTGPFLFNGGFVVVKDTTGRELLLDVKGIGAFDGTFNLRQRTIFRGVLDGARLTTQTTVGRGYLVKSNADADLEHLQALDQEPMALVSGQSVPVFQADFILDGQKFSIEARLSPGNRRLGQYWKGSELSREEELRNAETLGKSVAGMLLEQRPVVHRAFNMENFLDPITQIASYGNPGSVTYLDTQRRAMVFMHRWLSMSEERVTHKWGHEKEPADPELAQIFWNGFIDFFLDVVGFSTDIRQQLESLKAEAYSEEKRDKLLALIWKNYVVQRIFEARQKQGYFPERFTQPTYSGEADILPSMLSDTDWVVDELALYNTLLSTDYGKRHADQIRVQKARLLSFAKEKYPQAVVKIIRQELLDEFSEENLTGLNSDERAEAEQIKVKFLELLDRLEQAIAKGEAFPDLDLRLHSQADQFVGKSAGREERIGVMAVTGDPIHWGHLYSALSSMLLYKFDKVVILGPGKKDHKPGMVPRQHRQQMIERAVELFSPFLVYSTVGQNDYRLGEEHFIDLVDINSDKKAAFYYLRGDGSKNKMIQILANLCDLHAQTLVKAKDVRLGVAFIDRKKADEEIMVADPRIEVLNQDPEFQLVISSTRVKEERAFFLLPRAVREYISENELYTQPKGRISGVNVADVVWGVTGGTGDIGHSFINMLRNRGGSVQVLVRPGSVEKATGLVGEQGEDLRFIRGGLLNRSALHDLVSSTDVVYHFGAVVGQDLSGQRETVFAVNAISTALLSAVVSEIDQGKKVIYASSQRIYGIQERDDVKAFLQMAFNRIKEFVATTPTMSAQEIEERSLDLSRQLVAELPGDVNIYDVSKLLGERFIAELPNHVIARVSNAYGPDYQNPRLINRLFNAVVDGREISEPNETRDFIYQDDLNQILLALAGEESAPKEIDIASGTQVGMGHVKNAIVKLFPQAENLVSIKGEVRHTANQNSTYGEKLLGRKFTDIDTGLRNVADSFGMFSDKPVAQKGRRDIVVMDIGGTSTRIAVFGKDGEVRFQRKIDSPNFMKVTGGISDLQNNFIGTISVLIASLREQHPELSLDTIAIAFPGPVNDSGIITGAATLWGKAGEGIKYDVAKALKERVPGLENVYVLNDNSAAMLRYAKEKKQKNVSVVTVSSGISHKIYLRDRGGLLMDSDGLTGEIGHLRVDFSDDAPLCDCGGKGHLGAVASGRGAERMAQKLAAGEYKSMYETSFLFGLSSGDPKVINNEMLVKAIHENDAFALMVLDRTTAYLADVLAHVAVSSSIEKFIIVGGFAQAVGEQYIESLNKRLRQHDFYGRDIEFTEGLVELGKDDGLDNLIGMGQFARDKIKDEVDEQSDDLKQSGVLQSKVSSTKSMPNYFTRGVFDTNNPLLASVAGGRQVVVFVDKNVASQLGSTIGEYFEKHKQYFVSYKIHVIDGDEKSKTLESTLGLVRQALDDGANRKAVFVAIGGGAMMDTVGFAAQLYRRGVDYIRVPTTLLSIIDAAVGIKVGVNYNQHKNFIGAFYPPMAIVSDTSFIQSLDARQLRGGIAEILKVAIISNKGLFEEIEKYGPDLVNPAKVKENPYRFEGILKEAALELVKHLEADFFEKDLMRHVDFGHAFAHTFEDASDYDITHGEAVGMDILISSHIAMQRGLLPTDEFNRLVGLYKALGLPLIDPRITEDVIRKGMESYTAHKGGKMLMVIPKAIGRTQFADAVSAEEITTAISSLRTLGDSAMSVSKMPGGIDLTRDKMNIQRLGSENGVQFKFDSAMIQQLQNASGLTPIIFDIHPMTTTVPMFLGLKEASSTQELSMR